MRTRPEPPDPPRTLAEARDPPPPPLPVFSNAPTPGLSFGPPGPAPA